jgi:signal transduction histidine kinase
MANPKEHISARLSRAKTELEEALVEIEKLPIFEAGTVAFAAHALNNFLTVTGATTELLKLHLASLANAEVNALLAGLMHTSDLMTYTVARLMNTAVRNDAVLVSREVDLVMLIERARDYYQRTAEKKQIEIIAESPVPVATVWTDSVAVAAALDNLLTNAVKYSPPGKKVWIHINVEPTAVVCSVRDEGPGLSPEDQARLFQKGVQLTPRPTAGESSTGYGLAVAKELITRVGGTIWCESQLGAGACFSFRLPKTRPAESATAAPTPPS